MSCTKLACTCNAAQSYRQGRSDERTAILAALWNISPMCREPSLFATNPDCNHWLGVLSCITMIEEMK
jgi:hypothetical protein